MNDSHPTQDEPTEHEYAIQSPAAGSPAIPTTENASPIRKKAPKWLRELIPEAIEVMQRRANRLERPIPTPWESVNRAIRGGFWPGLYTLTSASGMGKTQWALQCALRAAREFADRARLDREELKRQGLPGEGIEADRVVYVALELGSVDLVARVLGLMEPECKWSDLFFGNNPTQLTLILERHGREISSLPLQVEIADALGWTYENLRDLARDHKPKLIVLDYAQLVSSERREELRHTIGNVAKVGRDIARKQGISVLVLCSTARGNYGKVSGTSEDDKPCKVPLGQGDAGRLIDLGKESGELEFTADCVLTLARESKNDTGQERRSWLAIAKGRGFPTGWVELRWNGSAFTEASLEDFDPCAFSIK